MRLLRFRVTNFRSVDDSGWIEVNGVTALIGTNESGKTNLLVPLWKLNPAKEGEVDTTADYPRKLFNEFRKRNPQPVFIEAIFQPSSILLEELVSLTGGQPETFEEIQVQRQFDGVHIIEFPKSSPKRSVPTQRILELIDDARSDVEGAKALKSEEELRTELTNVLSAAREQLVHESVSGEQLRGIRLDLAATMPDEPAKTSVIIPQIQQVIETLNVLINEVSKPEPSQVGGISALVVSHLPKFVYYSNYGNLDSEIYLPHVIENLQRTDLGARDQAKARTLKVLFEFVQLSPQEILDLGKDLEYIRHERQPTTAEIEEIAEIAENKKQRSILLQSASTSLTSQFRDWWKQGEYRFRFEADGNHFRIWVSDDKRPEEIELEGRSTGLQWFLSFYLVFLVESQDAHEGAILLLDEPGLSLHPLAQRDLSIFFEGLAETNQLLYTTHSPFLVDADHLDRARKVYVAADGTTKATPDLRGGENDPNQQGSNYAVFAAVGISVAESLMLGCTPVVVEGPSDQIYLSAIKILLIASGRLTPGRELVFAPAGGVKGVKALASLLGSKIDELPPVLVDSDLAGQKFAKDLRSSLYQGMHNRVLEIGEILEFEGAEIEDLIPTNVFSREVDRYLTASEEAFADTFVIGKPVVPQIEAWASANRIDLKKGWKVELAGRVKRALLTRSAAKLDAEMLDSWGRLFAAFQEDEAA